MSLTLRDWKRPDRGVLFVVTGCSGTGKTTLVREALTMLPGLEFSVSATTRPIREGETDGVDYRFVDTTTFESMVQGNALLEWAEVYGNRYGTPRAPVEDALSEGRSILLEIDAQGARQVRETLPEAVTLFVLPPSLEVIEQRLRSRSTDTEQVITRRMAEAQAQLQDCGLFDYLVVNGDLASAHDVFQSILVAEMQRTKRRQSWVGRFAPSSI
ncbi:MAG: guanylate kinase [Myxococcota bacterium]|nr:guanylate kinase [Myxococcota bacterium]